MTGPGNYPPPPPPPGGWPPGGAYPGGAYQGGAYPGGPYPGGPVPGGPVPPAVPARFGPGPGLLVAAAGVICVAVSLFGLRWASGDKGSFGDIGSALRKAGSAAAPDLAVYSYFAWAGWVLLAAAVIVAVLATVPVPPTTAGNTYARVAVSVVAALGAILNAWAMHRIKEAHGSLHPGETVALIGWILLLVAAVLGARRIRS